MPRVDEAASVMARRSAIITKLMSIYMRLQVRRHFHAVRLGQGCLPRVDPDTAVIVYSNHPSWWDPVMFVLLHTHVFRRRRGYGPMEATSLKRYGVLRRIGVFGLDLATRRGAAQFLQISARILQTTDTVLWVTAEGGFTDPRRRPVRLRPGLAHLLRGREKIVVIPLAMEFPFWNESAPEALLRFGTPLQAAPDRSLADWESLLEQRLSDTMDHLAEDAMTRDPSRFDLLVSGRVGVGGIYDLWRSRGLLLGRRPHLEHETAER